MTGTQLFVLTPLIILAVTAVIVMLASAFGRRHGFTAGLTLSGLAAAFLALFFIQPDLPQQVTPLLVVDGYALFYLGLLLVTTAAVAVQGYGYLKTFQGDSGPFYILLLLATLGSAVLVTSSHFASFFLGLETLSISLYALIAYTRSQKERVEAALKYLILAGTTAAFLLFGMALIYAETGTMSLPDLAGMFAVFSSTPILLLGVGLLLVGVAFKLALVPFHLWTPDVYQGAPAPVTGFVATVSKGGMLVLLLRYLVEWGLLEDGRITAAITLIAVASMLAGNLLALRQENVKRLLAYSSIAHLGYLLVPVVAVNNLTMQATAFYLAVYFLTTLCAFGVVALLSTPREEREELDSYEGLLWRRPYLASIFSLALLSLAGLPPLAGLVGKIYLVSAGIISQLWLLLAALVIGSVLGVYYYARVIVTMARRVKPGMEPSAALLLRTPPGIILVVLSALLIVLGLYPTPLIRLISAVIPGLS